MNRVWYEEGDIPSEVDTFNDDNKKQQKREKETAPNPPVDESKPTSTAGLGGKSAVSAMSAFQ